MFFPEIDREKTKSNARRKLREYPRWKRIAGDAKEQKVTATYSFEPRQPHGTPSKPVERLAVNKASAEQELDAIEQAVTRLFNPVHRRVLVEKYLSPYQNSDLRIMSGLDYEASQYYDILNNALLAFAESYRNGILVSEIGERPEKDRRKTGERPEF